MKVWKFNPKFVFFHNSHKGIFYSFIFLKWNHISRYFVSIKLVYILYFLCVNFFPCVYSKNNNSMTQSHFFQGNYFLFIELTSQLHRTLVPIPVWLFYLLDHNDRIPSKVLGNITLRQKSKNICLTILKCWNTSKIWKFLFTKKNSYFENILYSSRAVVILLNRVLHY